MRVIRSLILVLGVAIAAAGCAQQPAAYMAYPTAASGIDSVVYGGAGPYAPAMMGGGYGVGGPYAPAMAGAYGAAPYGGLYGYASAPAPSEGYYMLDSGDRLRVVVFGQDGLTNSYVVGAGGYIDMPLIGSVAARGVTTDQLASRIADKLRDGYIREPHVAVEIEAYRPFFILGEVTAPGQYPYVANMTAETAVAIAGGFTARAFRKTVTLNRNYYGRQIRIAVPLAFPLRPGDTINVQERWF
jgi:polysaccharide export outer membrane protein